MLFVSFEESKEDSFELPYMNRNQRFLCPTPGLLSIWVLIFFLSIDWFLKRERKVERKRWERDINSLFHLCTCWLLIAYALTRDGALNLGVSGWCSNQLVTQLGLPYVFFKHNTYLVTWYWNKIEINVRNINSEIGVKMCLFFITHWKNEE